MDIAIQNLASALGGRDLTNPAQIYAIGDDGLGCLKDLKRWLQHHDEKHGVWDVKSIMAEKNLVETDLCPLLASWTPSETRNQVKWRTSLACVELLVPMTWPMEVTRDSPRDQLELLPNLKLAQSSYKRSLLFNADADILGSIIRVALKPLSVPRRERNERDTGIIRLILYLLRNLAQIDEDSRRSETILSFRRSGALSFIATLASSMGEEFEQEDVIVLDVLYYLLRGVKVATVFDRKVRNAASSLKDLSDLLSKESDMKRSRKSKAHTRHNRFGTMISVVTTDQRRFTVASQTAVLQSPNGSNFDKIDAAKKWNKPHRAVASQDDVQRSVSLSQEACLAVKDFIDEFLNSAFNPLFSSVLRALENDQSRVSVENRLQYLYLQGFFFRALREMGKIKYAKDGEDFADDADYGLIASMLEQRALIMMRKMLRESIDLKDWKETHAAMDCFKEILLTLQYMSQSSEPQYQEIADNIQNNIYYEESSLESVSHVVKLYSSQSFGYLNACTELLSVLLRMLEKYCSSKSHMFVRAKRRRQEKKKKQKEVVDQTVDQSDDEAAAEAAKNTASERAFEFSKFENKFLDDHCVETHAALLEYYAELSPEQIKRVISFFHRVFVKRGKEVLLFRLDICELLNRIVNDRDGFPSNNQARSEVETFVKYFTKRLIRSLEDAPALAVELLFTKPATDAYYLTHNHDKAPKVTSAPRAPVEIEVKPGMTHSGEVSVVVAALLDANKSEVVEWLKSALTIALNERKAWESEYRARAIERPDRADAEPVPSAIVLKPESEDISKLLFKDGKARLLLKLMGLSRIGDDDDVDASWIVPADLDVDTLGNNLELIKQYTHNPASFDDKAAADLLRRKPKQKQSYHSDGDASPSESEGEDMSRPRNSTKSKTSPVASESESDADHEYDSKHRKLSKKKDRKKEKAIKKRIPRLLDDEEIEERKRKKAAMEEERQNQFKSSKYIVDSDNDEEADRVFFAKEEELRKRMRERASDISIPNPENDKRRIPKQRAPRKRPPKKMTSKTQKDSNGTPEVSSNLFMQDSASSDDENESIDRIETDDAPQQLKRKANSLFVHDSSGSEDNASERKLALKRSRTYQKRVVAIQDESDG